MNLSTRITAAFIALIIIGSTAMMFVEELRLRDDYISQRESYLKKSLDAESIRFSQTLNTLAEDVLFLSNTPPVQGIARATQNRGYDAAMNNTSLDMWESRLVQIFGAFSKAHPVYYKIRYISLDQGGRELVRVGEKTGSAYHKSDRDYVQGAARLHAGEVYFSEFRAAREDAAGRSSHLLTLHASTPVFAPDGKLFGVVVINLDASALLKSATLGLPGDVGVQVAAMDGKYLYRSDSGVMTDEKRTLAMEAPELEGALSGSADQLSLHLSGDNGGQLIAAQRIHFDATHPARFLLLIYRIPELFKGNSLVSIPAGNFVLGLLFAILACGMILFFLRRSFEPLNLIAVNANKIAKGDFDIVLPPGGKGEIGIVSEAINHMLACISQRERSIFKLNEELEARVQERTQALHDSNQHLQQEIDARMKAAEHLKKVNDEMSALFYRNQAMMKTASDGIHIMDIQGRVLEANDAFCKMLGYTNEEALNLNISQIDAQWSSAELLANFKSFIGRSAVFETVHRRKNGSLIHVEISSSGVLIDDQPYFFAASRDITERKAVLKELKLRESYLSAIIENQDGMVWLKDRQGRYLAVNRNYVAASGRSLAGILGRTDEDLWPEEIAAKYRADDARVIETGKSVLLEESGLDGGEQRWYETIKSPVLNDLGEIVATTGSSRDITNRKQVEDDLRISAITFETHEAIMITDERASIIRVNQAFTEITGYAVHEVLGKNPSMMSSGRQDKAFYEAMWSQLLSEGAWSGEIWDKRKNGEIYPKWLNITAVRNQHHETTRYVAIFSDITDRKRTEEEIRSLAFYDVLTKLPNRRLFLERFRAALSSSARNCDYGAVLFLDMDQFKQLNDTLGHECGDKMLIEVASRIRSCLRGVDTVARFGGDEFVVLIEALAIGEEAAARSVANLAEKIRIALAMPYYFDDHEHLSSPSIGISLFRGDELGVDELIRQADVAMYRAKNSGRNAVCFFNAYLQG